MSLFDQLGGGAQQSAPMNPQQMLAELKAHPATMLKQAGLNIPEGMSNPQQIVQHLIQSGQIPQARVQQAMRMFARK